MRNKCHLHIVSNGIILSPVDKPCRQATHIWRWDKFFDRIYQQDQQEGNRMDGADLRHIGTRASYKHNHQWFSFPLSVEWYKQRYSIRRTLMMKERTNNMKYVSCPSCGRPLFKVTGKCSVEITCSRCRKEIFGEVNEIYMKIFENGPDLEQLVK